MNLRIYKSRKRDEIFFEPPPDKSITHRVFLLSAFSGGICRIENPLISLDTLATLRLLKSIGVRVEKNKAAVKIYGLKGRFKKVKERINCANSGSTMRIGSGVLAGIPEVFYLYGDKSLMNRPMKRVKIPLELMGAKINLRDDTFPPLIIEGSGRLKPIEYTLKIPSAQVKSAILFAGLYTGGGVKIYSAPSRNHTELMFKAAGIDIEFFENVIYLKKAIYPEAFNFRVYGDPSSAVFFAVLGILHNRAVTVSNVVLNPTRIYFYELLKKMGVSVKFIKKFEHMGEIVGDIHLNGFPSKALTVKNNIPFIIDEIPLIGVMGAFGEVCVRNAKELRFKESDRISSICSILKAFGADVVEYEDGFYVKKNKMKHFEFASDDHRMVMAASILMSFTGGVIRKAESVRVSFPDYWSLFNKFV